MENHQNSEIGKYSIWKMEKRQQHQIKTENNKYTAYCMMLPKIELQKSIVYIFAYLTLR